MTLMLASALNANGQIILLALALVPAETKEWWAWFLGFVGEAYDEGGINDEEGEPVVFISDRDKGLEGAIDEEFPEAYHAM